MEAKQYRATLTAGEKNSRKEKFSGKAASTKGAQGHEV